MPIQAQEIVTLLLPVLPYLLKAGEAAAGELGKQGARAALQGVKALWNRLRPGLQARPQAWQAVRDAAARPQDPAAQAALRQHLEALLRADPALAADIARLVAQTKAPGARSVTIGGSVHHSIIITGDGNEVTR